MPDYLINQIKIGQSVGVPHHYLHGPTDQVMYSFIFTLEILAARSPGKLEGPNVASTVKIAQFVRDIHIWLYAPTY